MRTPTLATALLLLAGCAGRSAAPVTPAARALPDAVAIYETATGHPLDPDALYRRSR